MNVNLVFTLALSIYYLVIIPTNTEVFILKLPGSVRSGYTSKKIFLMIPWTKILHPICLLREALNRTVYQKCKKFQVSGCLIEIQISALHISTESAKKTTIYNLLFLYILYSLENDTNQPFEMRIFHHSSNFTVAKVFLGLGPILATGLK